MFLAVFGRNVEDGYGHLHYLLFYLAGGFVATATRTVMTLLAGSAADARVPNLGANGTRPDADHERGNMDCGQGRTGLSRTHRLDQTSARSARGRAPLWSEADRSTWVKDLGRTLKVPLV